MHYNVVLSIYEEVCTCQDKRIDSQLLRGHLKTEDDAMRYINEHCSNIDYSEMLYPGKTYAYLEIEVCDESGSVAEVISVD